MLTPDRLDSGTLNPFRPTLALEAERNVKHYIQHSTTVYPTPLSIEREVVNIHREESITTAGRHDLGRDLNEKGHCVARCSKDMFLKYLSLLNASTRQT